MYELMRTWCVRARCRVAEEFAHFKARASANRELGEQFNVQQVVESDDYLKTGQDLADDEIRTGQ